MLKVNDIQTKQQTNYSLQLNHELGIGLKKYFGHLFQSIMRKLFSLNFAVVTLDENKVIELHSNGNIKEKNQFLSSEKGNGLIKSVDAWPKRRNSFQAISSLWMKRNTSFKKDESKRVSPFSSMRDHSTNSDQDPVNKYFPGYQTKTEELDDLTVLYPEIMAHQNKSCHNVDKRIKGGLSKVLNPVRYS